MQYEPPPGLAWDDETYRGSAYGRVRLGLRRGRGRAQSGGDLEVRPTHVTARLGHRHGNLPAGARGQVEGGTAQGLGYALTEEVVMRDGGGNAQLTNYIVPTTMDTPTIDIVSVEQPCTPWPYGAKAWARCHLTAWPRPS